VSTRRVVVVGLLMSALLAGVVSFYASSHPDGLEHVAGGLGFAASARDSATAGSPLAGYAVEDVGDPRLSGGLAGLSGVLVVGLVMTALLLLLRRRRGSTDPDA
jgi:cobalt/nickel transport protein